MKESEEDQREHPPAQPSSGSSQHSRPAASHTQLRDGERSRARWPSGPSPGSPTPKPVSQSVSGAAPAQIPEALGPLVGALHSWLLVPTDRRPPESPLLLPGFGRKWKKGGASVCWGGCDRAPQTSGPDPRSKSRSSGARSPANGFGGVSPCGAQGGSSPGSVRG